MYKYKYISYDLFFINQLIRLNILDFPTRKSQILQGSCAIITFYLNLKSVVSKQNYGCLMNQNL